MKNKFIALAVATWIFSSGFVTAKYDSNMESMCFKKPEKPIEEPENPIKPINPIKPPKVDKPCEEEHNG